MWNASVRQGKIFASFLESFGGEACLPRAGALRWVPVERRMEMRTHLWGAQLAPRSPESRFPARCMPLDVFLGYFGCGKHVSIIQKGQRRLVRPPGAKIVLCGWAGGRRIARDAPRAAERPPRLLVSHDTSGH